MTLLRLAGAVALLAVGAATGVAGVVTHDLWWGLPLVAGALVTAMVAVGRGWLTRLPLAIGLVAGIGAAAPTRAEGDFLIGANTRGYVLLGIAFVAVVAAVVTLPRPGRARQPGTAGPDTYTRGREQAGA